MFVDLLLFLLETLAGIVLLMLESVVKQFENINTALRLYRFNNPTCAAPEEGFSQTLQSQILSLMIPLSALRSVTKQVQDRQHGSIALIIPMTITVEKIASDCVNQTGWLEQFGIALQTQFTSRINKHYRPQNVWKDQYLMASFLAPNIHCILAEF
jgi:hypothetical protein